MGETATQGVDQTTAAPNSDVDYRSAGFLYTFQQPLIAR
jgi:hypothetical protein